MNDWKFEKGALLFRHSIEEYWIVIEKDWLSKEHFPSWVNRPCEPNPERIYKIFEISTNQTTWVSEWFIENYCRVVA